MHATQLISQLGQRKVLWIQHGGFFFSNLFLDRFICRHAPTALAGSSLLSLSLRCRCTQLATSLGVTQNSSAYRVLESHFCILYCNVYCIFLRLVYGTHSLSAFSLFSCLFVSDASSSSSSYYLCVLPLSATFKLTSRAGILPTYNENLILLIFSSLILFSKNKHFISSHWTYFCRIVKKS